MKKINFVLDNNMPWGSSSENLGMSFKNVTAKKNIIFGFYDGNQES